MATVRDQRGDIRGQEVFWREARGDGDVPVVYVHGNPTSSDDWLPFLERTGGIAPDLPGFGRSAKRGDGDYTIDGYDRWFEAFLEAREIDRFRLVVHDWGAVALQLAQRHPERVERLVVMDAVPLLPGYRWHRIARAWRTPVLGEVAMGMITRPVLKLLSREMNATKGPMPDEFVDSIHRYFDPGTQRAVLRLYRSAPPAKLAEAGERLGDIKCPALVVWGDHDPYIPKRFADGYAATLGDAELLHIPEAGHWPWLDRPDLVDTIASFLTR
jgi:pimeloyl-ACP methyl ester carboxylesterase